MRVRRFDLRVAAVTAIVALVAAGCHSKTWVEVTVVVSGTVLDSVSRAPIESAWVSGVPAPPTRDPIYTDSLGFFSFARGPFGRDSLFAGKQGYTTGDILIENGRSDVTGLLFELVRAGGSK